MKKMLSTLLLAALLLCGSFAIAENDDSVFVFCDGCMLWYHEGSDFINHDCIYDNDDITGYVHCQKCLGWYEEGNIYRNHVCVSDEPDMVQCDVCGGWFEEGSIFRNHICISDEPGMVQCDVCGGWFEEGSIFRNHICVSDEPTMVHCEVCGGWYEEGNIYRNHICLPSKEDVRPIGTVYVKTNGNNLRLRANPSTDSYVVANLPNGAKLTLYERIGSWSCVGYNGKLGYCSNSFLSNKAPAKAEETVETEAHGTAEASLAEPFTFDPYLFADFVHNFDEEPISVFVELPEGETSLPLYWVPSIHSPAMRVFFEGHELTVLCANEEWCQVLDGEDMFCGYVQREFLSPFEIESIEIN